MLVVAGCSGVKYQPYNGPNGAQPPAAAQEPGAAPEPGQPNQAAAVPAPPQPDSEPVPESDHVSINDVAKTVKASIQLTSTTFGNGAQIPSRFTCDGYDGSPDLAWSGIPTGAVELAVTMEDPKAPHGGFTHWALFGLKPSLTRLGASQVPAGAKQGMNDFHQNGYGGPCPGYTDGTHRYVITLYALKAQVPLTDGARPDQVRDLIDGSAIAKGRLTGTYRRRG